MNTFAEALSNEEPFCGFTKNGDKKLRTLCKAAKSANFNGVITLNDMMDVVLSFKTTWNELFENQTLINNEEILELFTELQLQDHNELLDKIINKKLVDYTYVLSSHEALETIEDEIYVYETNVEWYSVLARYVFATFVIDDDEEAEKSEDEEPDSEDERFIADDEEEEADDEADEEEVKEPEIQYTAEHEAYGMHETEDGLRRSKRQRVQTKTIYQSAHFRHQVQEVMHGNLSEEAKQELLELSEEEHEESEEEHEESEEEYEESDEESESEDEESEFEDI
jgi:hypothetical protein